MRGAPRHSHCRAPHFHDTAHATANLGTVRVTGEARSASLQSEAARFAPGPVPAGRYRVMADFGSGMVEAGTAEVHAGHTLTVRCSAAFQLCTMEADDP